MEIGNIYHHPIEGVCILAQITESKYRFLAPDIDARFPSNQQRPREFLTAKEPLPKPTHISLLIRHNAFTYGSIVYYLESAICHWGYSLGRSGGLCLIGEYEFSREPKQVSQAVCFQVHEDCGLHKSIDCDALEVA